jgi:hypothetical protein
MRVTVIFEPPPHRWDGLLTSTRPLRHRSRFWDWTFDELLEALLIEARTGRMPAREELSGHA